MPPGNISNDLSNSQLYDLLIKAIKDHIEVLKSEININIQDLSNKVETVDTKVAIANDIPYEDRQVQRVLKVHLRNAKRQNNRARIRGNKLEIDGKFFTLDDLSNLEVLASEKDDSYGEGEEEEAENE
ncbi:unnamed protein product [Psylliodes chrysocephalus]|uniref:Uncharacterized protein n=1 Tax=Psylliodes chrysocephalus TaxID=3402493 RepID=A0A9P0GD07_9CUCU|nr:unnamed protein product [Psylliodes chrysocephala]